MARDFVFSKIFISGPKERVLMLSNKTRAYLRGGLFSSSLSIKLSQFCSKPFDRIEAIVEYCKNKQIIHLGCVDHIEIIEDKIKNQTWLHGRITDTASRLIGIDVNTDGIDYLRSKKGIKNVFYGDIENSSLIQEIVSEQWDCIIVAEVLEHVDNPTKFLKNIKTNYEENIREILLSVPNATSFNNWRHSLFNRECINSDHRFWFTGFTLCKVLTIAGYNVESVKYVNAFTKTNLKNWPKLLLTKVFPLLRDTVLVRATFK